jgi:hypothetical protein
MHRQITHAVISGVKRPGLALLDQQRAPGGEGIFVPVHDGHTVLCQDDRQNIPLGVRVLKQFVARWPNKERRIQVGARNSPHRTGLLNADSPSSTSSSVRLRSSSSSNWVVMSTPDGSSQTLAFPAMRAGGGLSMFCESGRLVADPTTDSLVVIARFSSMSSCRRGCIGRAHPGARRTIDNESVAPAGRTSVMG